MVQGPADMDNIYVGGDDLTAKAQSNNKEMRFNFNGTQNIVLSQQTNMTHVPQQKGFSPMSKKAADIDFKEFHSQGSGTTFGLGKINKKKQII